MKPEQQTEETCYSFSKGFGACKGCEPGTTCKTKPGRLHRCHGCGGAHTHKDCPKKGSEGKGKGKKKGSK